MKRHFQKWMVAGLVGVLMIVLAACTPAANSETTASEHSDTKGASEVLRVGMELKYPPFETKDTQGNPDGVSVAMARALGAYLGRDVEIVETEYSSLIPALEQGNIDVIISSMTITEKREEVVDFSDPYTTSPLMMLVYKDSKVNSPADLNDPEVTIVAKLGTVSALWAAEYAPKAQVKNIEEEASAVLEVAQGKADVFIYDPMSVIRHQAHYPDTTRTVLEPLPNTKGWGIAMRKGEVALKSEINAFLKAAKTDGTFDTIRDTYLKEEAEIFETYGLAYYF